ncbi:MAG: VWA domain-containing protein [Acidobacteria bacterium]|nr:VWA domain-containing protein [Acidobacteriota bacterium]
MIWRRPLAVVLLVAAMPIVAHAQKPTFASRVEAVRVDVLVRERGKPVRGLGPGDFEVFDNGIRQEVDLVSFEQLPLNVVLTLDMSESVIGERLQHLRAAGRALLVGLRKGDQAALVGFGQSVTLGADLTTDIGRVRAALDHEQSLGNTSLVDASYAGMMIGESDVGRALVIVFSDGLDTSSWLEPDAVLGIAKRCDAVVYAVSVGRSQRAGFLSELSEQTGGRLFEIESTKNLSAVFLEMLDEFRQRYVVGYSPAGVPIDGWHKLTVRVKGRDAAVKARPGYLAGK